MSVNTTQEIEITAGKAIRWLGGVIVLLLLANAVGLVLAHGFGQPRLFGLVPLFNLNTERSLPTWFSSFQLLVGASLACLIAVAERDAHPRDVPYWGGLTIIFLFFSIDEIIMLHEGLDELAERFVEADGLLYWPWVIFYGFGAVLLALLYLRFLLRLERPVALLLVTAGALYVGGAAGVEMQSAAHFQRHGDGLGYSLWTSLEETLELAGACLFVYALLSYRSVRVRMTA